MSDAVFRHATATGVKQELLKEIDHWKRSSNSCLSDITHKLGLLKEAKNAAKTEINFARACLEEQLKDLEEKAETQIQNLVMAEERTVQEFIKSMTNKQKRLRKAESQLTEDLVGYKLDKAIKSGRQYLQAVREELVRIQKRDIPITIRFSLSRHLDSILTGIGSFGETVLRGHNGKLIKKAGIFMAPQSKYSKYRLVLEERKMEEAIFPERHDNHAQNFFETGGQELNGDFDEFEAVYDMKMKDETSTKPFTETIDVMSRKLENQHNTDKAAINDTLGPSHRQTSPGRGKQSGWRPQSAYEAKRLGTAQTRKSKSAREDARSDATGLPNTSEAMQAGQGIRCLNDVQAAYTPHEEQGPETKRSSRGATRGKQNVRYLDYDMVKEITRLKDHGMHHADAQSQSSSNGDTSDKRSVANSLDTVTLEKRIGFLSATPGLTAIKYIPSRDQSPDSKSQSFFTYKARFHTRKHTDETDLCRLAGIAVLDTGKIVVTDINHMKVMLFGDDFTYRFAMQCPSPSGICVVEPNVVAVTLFHHRKVMLIRVFAIHMERYKEFYLPCKEHLYSIAYRHGRFYVLCGAGDIHVIGDDGKPERDIQTEITGEKARHVEVDENGEMIYVGGSDRVVCFNRASGERVWQYFGNSDKRKFTPSGLCLMNRRLFVADWRSSHVVELSTEGSHVRDVITDNLDSPQAMSVQKYMSRLYITQSNMFKHEARSRTVKVFVVR